MQEFLKTKKVFAGLAFTVLVFAAGFYVGLHKSDGVLAAPAISSGDSAKNPEAEIDLSYFWKVWQIIDEKYPEASEISDEERLYGAISGLLGSLDDPYSAFFNPDETKSFQEDISGTFSGVGIEVGIKDKVLTVISPLQGTPAYRAGIQSGDKIIKIDDTLTANFTMERAIRLIRGDRGTAVMLTIVREGEPEPLEITIVRDTINMPTLDTELRPDNIFVIKLYSFSANASQLFRNALREFANADTDKLIIDLRGNPGGYLEAAIDISSWFLPSGKVVVTENYGQMEEPRALRSKGYDIFNDNLKVVILINGGSASASEIVAGALRDHKLALLVGNQSYGKGSVQEVLKVTGDTIVKITVAKWLTPNGISISEQGLTPDYEVKMAREDVVNKRDPQLDKAVELLNKWPGVR